MPEDNSMKCPYHYDHENRLRTVEEATKDLDNRVTKIDKDNSVMIEKLFGILEPLTKLPDSLNELSRSNMDMRLTMKEMQAELSNNTKEISDVKLDIKEQIGNIKNDVKQINNENSFHITQFIKDHFVSFSASVIIIIGIGTYILGNLMNWFHK